MSTMTSINQLKIEADLPRLYRSSSTYIGYAQSLVADFGQRHPEAHRWQECVKVTREITRKEPYEMALKHMIRWGKADARIIEDAFRVLLPPSVHEFYSEIQEAVLFWKNIFHILHPCDVVAWEREYRMLCEEENLPLRLIRFCKLRTGDGDSIAFRLSEDSGKWSIVHASVETPTKEVQSPLYDDPAYQLSDDLDDWLLWLMKHDGLICLDERQWVERIG